jgi:short-subunit dehydrogenase involved in D-alanine esterification of teichoic acids
MKLKNRTVLITGGTSDIGLELAKPGQEAQALIRSPQRN